MLLSVVLSLLFQYVVAPAIIDAPSYSLSLTYLRNAWTDGCNTLSNKSLQAVCVGNMGVFRVGLATMIFFVLAALAAWCQPTANRQVWPAKVVLYLFFVAAMCFIPNQPLFADIYLNLGRIGGVIFIFLQQMIIVDCAHNWNDSWVDKADKADVEEAGTGKKWLGAILVSCAVLLIGSFVGIVLMFLHFTGCRSNTAFIASTLCLCIVITLAQLSGGEGSLLSSSCVSAWAVYLLYNAVTKNPNQVCNPMLGQSDALSIALGIIITVISLGWTGWSYTAEDKLTTEKQSQSSTGDDNDIPAAAEAPSTETKSANRAVTGIVVTGDAETETIGDNGEYVRASKNTRDEDTESPNKPSSSSSNNNTHSSWRLNMILVMVTCWTSMTLTKWGDISTDGSVANPSVGDVAMWMLMASQWIVLFLYLWTLVAPRLFPDRDFS